MLVAFVGGAGIGGLLITWVKEYVERKKRISQGFGKLDELERIAIKVVKRQEAISNKTGDRGQDKLNKAVRRLIQMARNTLDVELAEEDAEDYIECALADLGLLVKKERDGGGAVIDTNTSPDVGV